MSESALIDMLRVSNALGEGIVWNALDGCAWWTDIEQHRLYRWHPSSAAIHSYAVPERAGCFAFIDDSDELIVAFESGIALYHPGNGQVRWLSRSEIRSGRRFNDGRADRYGRFWAGTMVEDSDRAPAASAALYCVDRRGEVHRRLDGLQISNGLCFSPDGRYCYVADSPRHVIFRYSVDAESGQLRERRIFAETTSSAFPDGATVDSEGCVWSAHWGAGQVIRYTPAGRIDRILSVPTQQPSCVAFAGSNLDLLLVTSARHGLSASALAEDPAAGHVFIFRTGHAGLVESRYRNEMEHACASQPNTI